MSSCPELVLMTVIAKHVIKDASRAASEHLRTGRRHFRAAGESLEPRCSAFIGWVVLADPPIRMRLI